jgi:adiponectin receptor
MTADNEVRKTLPRKLANSLLCTWEELPPWQRDNHYILSGYRRESHSIRASILSVGYLHNESVNIWSHLIGALAFGIVGATIYLLVFGSESPMTLFRAFEHMPLEEKISLAAFFIGAVLCLGLSTTYHTLSNHSHRVAKFGNKLDYLGIVCLISGSFAPSIYYGFYCWTDLRWRYWTMISTLSAMLAVVCLIDTFATSAWRPLRATLFVLLGLSAVFPVFHAISLHGYNHLAEQMGLNFLIMQGALYIFGAFLYAARIPERFVPGKFDIFGSSHQLFHIFVLLAAATHLVGLTKGHEYWHTEGQCLH